MHLVTWPCLASYVFCFVLNQKGPVKFSAIRVSFFYIFHKTNRRGTEHDFYLGWFRCSVISNKAMWCLYFDCEMSSDKKKSEKAASMWTSMRPHRPPLSTNGYLSPYTVLVGIDQSIFSSLDLHTALFRDLVRTIIGLPLTHTVCVSG